MAVGLNNFSFDFPLGSFGLVWFSRRGNWKAVWKIRGGTAMSLEKLVYYIIPLVVLVLLIIWLLGGGGLFEGVKAAAKGIIEKTPKVTMGAEELKTEKKPTVYYLEHLDGTWRQNLEWEIRKNEKGELQAELDCLGCRYDPETKEILRFGGESEKQNNFAALMASAKNWAEIRNYPLSPEESLQVTDEKGTEWNINLLE